MLANGNLGQPKRIDVWLWGSPDVLFSVAFSFRDGFPDIGKGACRFFFRCPPRDFRLRCSYPLYCFADASPGNGAIPAVVTDLVTIASKTLRQPRLCLVACRMKHAKGLFKRPIRSH